DPQAAAAEDLFHGQPRSSRFLDPLVWKRRAYALTGSMLVLRLGVLDRRVDFVPHVRVQSLRYHQGPLMRAFGLGSVAVHSTARPITPLGPHRSVAAAKRFLTEHADRTSIARQRYDAAPKTAETAKEDEGRARRTRRVGASDSTPAVGSEPPSGQPGGRPGTRSSDSAPPRRPASIAPRTCCPGSRSSTRTKWPNVPNSCCWPCPMTRSLRW